MKNLFGFDNEYLDRYAGDTDSMRFKKLTTKANVDMVLNKFSPFSKIKKHKHNTKTVVAYTGSNIDNTLSPIEYNPGNKYASQILVNTKRVREHLDTLPIKDRDDEFIKMTKQAYVARAEHGAAKQRFISGNTVKMIEDLGDKAKVNDAKTGIEIGMQVAVAAQGVINDVPMIGGESEYGGKAKSLELADSLFTGKIPKTSWVKDMLAELQGMNKSRHDYNVWMDKFKTALDADYMTGFIEESDSHVLSDHIPLHRVYTTKPPADDDSKGSGACIVGHNKIEHDSKPEFVEDEKDHDTTYEETNDTLTEDELSKSDKDLFFNEDNCGHDGRKQSYNWDKRDRLMSTLAEALYESLAGKIGKIRSQNPAKRLNMRSLTSDIDDKIYVYKSPLGGKKLSLNLIVDTSGSMSGHYIKDSVDVVNCINKLALRGIITGNLMLSCSRGSSMMKLPVSPDLLPLIGAHNGGEGFRHTFGLRWKELQAADYNVALTDGQLTDGHIDKTDMHKAGIQVTGLYSMPQLKKDPKGATSYTNRLQQWFSKSAVRASSEELIYYLIDQAILNYEMNPRRAA